MMQNGRIIQLGDVLAFLIQQDGEVVDEFWQHDSPPTCQIIKVVNTNQTNMIKVTR